MDIVKVEGVALEEETYTRGRLYWKQTTLIKAIEEQGAKVFDLPLVGLNLLDINVDIDNFVLFIHHCKRVQGASLEFPIILDDFGQIANGRHRIARAIIEGRKTIKAVRLQYMPKKDGKRKK